MGIFNVFFGEGQACEIACSVGVVPRRSGCAPRVVGKIEPGDARTLSESERRRRASAPQAQAHVCALLFGSQESKRRARGAFSLFASRGAPASRTSALSLGLGLLWRVACVRVAQASAIAQQSVYDYMSRRVGTREAEEERQREQFHRQPRLSGFKSCKKLKAKVTIAQLIF